MVQTADFREGHHAARCRRLRAAWRGRVFRQGEMGPRSVIVDEISGKRAPQMRLIEDDHVIEDTRDAWNRSGALHTDSARNLADSR